MDRYEPYVRPEDQKTVTVSVRLTEDEHRYIKAVAVQTGIRKSAVLREMLFPKEKKD